MKIKQITKKRLILVNLIIFVILFSASSYWGYYANKPVFINNYIEDTFEDQIPGIFPMGWISGVRPFNSRVVFDDGNKVMEVRGTASEDVEIARRFKRTSKGIIECKVKIPNVNVRFVIHIPQLDREYDPYDDIIIAFLDGGIYVVGEDNLVTQEEDPTFWEQLILLNDNISWAINEQSLVDSDSILEYEFNIWVSIRIDFDRDGFSLIIDDESLGIFNYPRYNPPYFASLYFCVFATSYNFQFYVDNVKITLIQPVDYIHPGNVVFLMIMLISFIGFYILYKKNKGKKGRKKLK